MLQNMVSLWLSGMTNACKTVAAGGAAAWEMSECQ